MLRVTENNWFPSRRVIAYADVQMQRYVSQDLTHFVGASLKTEEKRFALLKKIIKMGMLQARPRPRPYKPGYWQMIKHTEEDLSSNRGYHCSIVCFCDIPLNDLGIHMQKYGRFGLAFRKDFLIAAGASPILYVPKVGRPAAYHFNRRKAAAPLPSRGISSQAVAFDRFWRYFNELHIASNSSQIRGSNAREIKEVIEFLDKSILSYLKFFDHRLWDDDPSNYYMEREWRTTKDVEFKLLDIQRIIVPTRFSRRLRSALPKYDGEVFFAD
jgi:abortive phage resistance protein AbiGi (putative antitoxin)